jgi:uncharacterized membrane protein
VEFLKGKYIMSLSLAFHVIALVMCFGSLLVISRVMAIAVSNSNSSSVIDYKALLKTFKIWSFGGLIILFASGIYQLLNKGIKFYMSQGWFHTKLLLIIFLCFQVFYLYKIIKSVSEGYDVGKGKFMMIHGTAGLVLILGVLLTFLGR